MLSLVVGTVDGVLGSEPEVTLLPSSASLWSPARRDVAAGTVNGMVRILKCRKKKLIYNPANFNYLGN